jgi:hypothetical protein
MNSNSIMLGNNAQAQQMRHKDRDRGRTHHVTICVVDAEVGPDICWMRPVAEAVAEAVGANIEPSAFSFYFMDGDP